MVAASSLPARPSTAAHWHHRIASRAARAALPIRASDSRGCRDLVALAQIARDDFRDDTICNSEPYRHPDQPLAVNLVDSGSTTPLRLLLTSLIRRAESQRRVRY